MIEKSHGCEGKGEDGIQVRPAGQGWWAQLLLIVIGIAILAILLLIAYFVPFPRIN
jgi:hypothetical protein